MNVAVVLAAVCLLDVDRGLRTLRATSRGHAQDVIE
jgi:hypothetical protein